MNRDSIHPLYLIIGKSLLIVMILLVWWFLFWLPNREKQANLTGFHQEQQAKLAQLQQERSAIKGTRVQIETLEKTLGEWGNQFPPIRDADRVINEITLLAKSYGMRAVRIKPWLKPAETPGRISAEVSGVKIERIPVTLMVVGRFTGAGRLMSQLSKLPYRVRLQEVTVRSSEQGGELYVLLDLYLYFYRD